MSHSGTGSTDSPGAVPDGRARQDVDERPPAPDIDISKPHVARMYDYFLGGSNNFAVDRAAAEQMLKLFPQTPLAAQANRRFLAEAVRWLAQEAGVRQFIDIGSGLPTRPNVHEVAQAVDKNTRVAYIDNDPLVRVHAGKLLAATPNTIMIEGDLRDPRALLDLPELREHIDFSQPVALLLVAVLHFIPETEQAYQITRTLYDALPSGSYVALSHATIGMNPEDLEQEAISIYRRANSGVFPRTSDEVAGFFTGLTPVGSGLVHISDWNLPGESGGNSAIAALADRAVLEKLPGMCGIARIDR